MWAEMGANFPMLTVSEVARLLHVHPNTVRKWQKQGLLRAYRLGRRGDRRFPLPEVERFLNAKGPELGLSPTLLEGLQP